MDREREALRSSEDSNDEDEPTKTALMYLVSTAALLVSLSAHATLTAEDGGAVVSDSALNVTWVNAVATGLIWDPSGGAGSAQAWIASLNAMNSSAGYDGYNDWQLPTGDGTYTAGSSAFGGIPAGGGVGLSTSMTANQLSWLFINELGNSYPNHTILGGAGVAFTTANTATLPSGTTTESLATALSNLDFIWTSTPEAGFPGNAWSFNAGGSTGSTYDGIFGLDVMAVRPGQVSAVPLPGAAWLLGSGLLGFGVIARKRRAT